MPAPFIWIVDATPLIVLAKTGRLDLLTQENRRVLIPETVAREVEAGRRNDPARLALAAGWGERIPDAPIPDALAEWRLDAGEEAALALALTFPDALVVVDDGDGRRAAQAFGIRMTGTVGVALQARQTGRIEALAPLLRDLRDVGLFLPPEATLRAVLQSEGEEWP
ncbi:MAG: DUF3368 domain-containing protein [Armatimonadota bacterium]|nr:DUF3368 domain-containing protein [Armatimonadota bacterium]